MANIIEEYDINKLKEAKKLILEVYEYNFKPSDSLSNKLYTLVRKIDNIIENHGEK